MNKILIVDDEKNILLVFKKALQSTGYQVSTATDGVEALDKASEISPDLILLDIVLPKLNGFMVYEALKEEPKTEDIPVIFISAKSEEEDIRKAEELGAKDYLVKPIKQKELLDTVKSVLKEGESNG